MKFWTTLQLELKNGHSIVLMYVIKSKGSSPGRQGFKMIVSQSGLLAGSIGGGVMEHTLVELCKTELLTTPFKPFVKKQIHQPNAGTHKSGLICSGQQLIGFYYLGLSNLTLINKIIDAYKLKKQVQLSLSNTGIALENTKINSKFQSKIADEENWELKENIHFSPQLHIIGGGHVSLALSKFAQEVGFEVTVYDDRANLNTVSQNKFATTKYMADYNAIASGIPNGKHTYVVIMSFGYKTDKVILSSLLAGRYKYLGMMGSQAKINTLFKELAQEGINKKELAKVYAPIGYAIASKTPAEIAISILAQVIKTKNIE